MIVITLTQQEEIKITNSYSLKFEIFNNRGDFLKRNVDCNNNNIS